MSLSGELIIMAMKGERRLDWEIADKGIRMLEEAMDNGGQEGRKKKKGKRDG